METRKDKTVFIEYSSTEKGQHFMTVIQIVDGKRKIIGRVYREYDKENKKMNYIATDWADYQIFSDAHDLLTIKKKYIESGKHLALTIPEDPKHDDHERLKPVSETSDREEEVRNIRKKSTEKEKGEDIER